MRTVRPGSSQAPVIAEAEGPKPQSVQTKPSAPELLTPEAPAAKGASPLTGTELSKTGPGVAQRVVGCVARLSPSVAAAAVGAGLTAVVLGTPVHAQEQSAVSNYESPVSGSILQPGSRSVADDQGLFSGTRIAQPASDDVRVDPDAVVQDPGAVMTGVNSTSGAAEIRRIINQRLDAPRTAEAVAAKLAELYGPYTPSNSEANRQAIIENLRWIAGIGVRYDNGRAGDGEITTHSPNSTLSNRSGVCRDTHTAAAAVLASLMNARQEGGRWVPGSPTGREGDVQTAGFATANENHAFLVYRNPASGGWDALEYGKSYRLDAPTAAEAVRALPNHIPGYHVYRVTGWDSAPVISSRNAVDAAAARSFFSDDPGVGEAGEVRAIGGADMARLTAFITPELSVSGELRESSLADTLQGGIKLNYHKDFKDPNGQGHVRYAGGVYTSAHEISDTGRRSEADRESVRTYVFALQYDSRYESNTREILGERLGWRYGYDMDMMVGIPLGPDGVVLGALHDYSKADVGVEGALVGRERLSPALTLDWAVQARYELDVLRAGTELMTSEGSSFDSFGADALRTDFALALTHRGDSGLITRFEAGGTQHLASPLDPQVSPQGSHYAVMSLAPEDGKFDFGVLARGRQLDGQFIPMDSLGVAFRMNPTENSSFGVSVDSVFPDGDVHKIGDNLQIMGNFSIKF